jgi:hypothetical protein
MKRCGCALEMWDLWACLLLDITGVEASGLNKRGDSPRTNDHLTLTVRGLALVPRSDNEARGPRLICDP